MWPVRLYRWMISNKRHIKSLVISIMTAGTYPNKTCTKPHAHARPWRIMLIFSWNYAFRIAEKIAELCYFYAKSYHFMPHYAHINMLLMYMYMMVLCKITRELFCRGRYSVVAKVQWGQRTVRPSYDRHWLQWNGHVITGVINLRLPGASTCTMYLYNMYNCMEFDANRRIMRLLCNLPRILRLFDFGRNYAKNYASIIRQGLAHATIVWMHAMLMIHDLFFRAQTVTVLPLTVNC